MTILHISDLHFVKNAGAYNMERILLREAEEAVRGKGEGEKLLIVTGDFHNFSEEDYEQAGNFLLELKDAMGLDMSKDVFVIPGNHDVGNDKTLSRALSGLDEFWKDNLENNVSRLKEGKRSTSIVNQRLRAFRPYSEFVKSLHIYDNEPAAKDDPDYPARVHVRCWRGKLNLLHLNTALAADGSPDKGNQVFDVDTAAMSETWENLDLDRIPALALGHNSFFDLAEGDDGHPSMKLQDPLMTFFNDFHVSAYLCGDTHRTEKRTIRQLIPLDDGRDPDNNDSIPNIVCAKSVADMTDTYSDFGYYLHEWNEKTDKVIYQFHRWRSEYVKGTREEGKREYRMRRAFARPKKKDPPAEFEATSASDQGLRAYLAETLRRTRDAHPSFKLIKVEEIDQKLFSNFKESEEKVFDQIPARGSVEKGGPVSPVWDIVRKSWEIKPVRNVVIEGEGGIGKTTALFSLCNAEDAKDVPAVYVPMHQLLRKDGTLIGISDYLEGLDKKKYGPQICDLTSVPMGDRPNLLVLLDGFNEVRADKRWDMLRAVNEWFTNHPGVQLVAVSRPMDGLNLGLELAGEPISITLEPLTREAVREHLEKYDRDIPPKSAPIWKDLRYPLFLMLFLKTGNLSGKTSAGYPLAPKKADSGGALIWNFLQRELMKQEDEDWVLRCAIACEYILPRIAWEMTERHSFVLDQDEAIDWTEQAMLELKPNALPKHLRALFQTYRRKHCQRRGAMPDFSGVDWPLTVLHDCGVLVPYQEEQKDEKEEQEADENPRFSLMHQNFRDCLAALHLVNAAEAAKEELPQLWRRSHNPYLLDYAAELMGADTAAQLWETVRTLHPTDNAAVCTQLELQKRRGDGRNLDFSGMDLSNVSLAPFLRPGEGRLNLFHRAALSVGTELASDTFRFLGQSGWVTCVAVLPDGRCVSGFADGTLRVWDIERKICVCKLEGHDNWVTCVATLPDGRCISGSRDGTLRVWDYNSRKCICTLDAHGDWVRCVAALPNGRCVSGSDDGTLRVWDIEQQIHIDTLEGHKGSVTCVAALSGGRCVSGSDDGTLHVWDIENKTEINTLERHRGSVTCVAALPNGLCISGSDDGTLQVWDVENKTLIHTLEGHRGSVTCVEALPDGRCVSGSDDETLLVWDIEHETLLHALDAHTSSVLCVVTLPGGGCISGSGDGTLRVWDIERESCLLTLEGHSRWVNCVAEMPDGFCVSGSGDGTLRVWDLKRGICLNMLKEHRGSISCVTVLPDGRFVSGSSDRILRIWDIKNETCLPLPEKHTNWVRCVAVLPDGRCISGSYDKTLRIWDIQLNTCLRTLEGHSRSVNCVVVLPDGRCVSGSRDGIIRVWDIKHGTCLRTLEGHSRSVNCVAALPDRRCVSGSGDGTLRIWDCDSGNCLLTMKGHGASIRCLVSLPDGRCVSGSRDRTLRIWDCDTGKCLCILEGHSDLVRCVAALSDGRCISGSDDGTLRIWDPDTGKCLNIITPMDIDVRGMDFSQAILLPDLAKQLYQNGAKVPDKYYRNYLQRKP